jgi:hypothetical protein
MDSHPTAIEPLYHRRVEQFAAAERRWAGRERLVMNLRVAIFLAALAAAVAGWKSQRPLPWYVGAGLALAGFVAAVAYHERVRDQLLRNGLLRQINEQAIARLRREWSELPEMPVAVPREHRATADDLDLFGHASLFQLLNWATTPVGMGILRDWLLEPAPPDEIKRRQQAAAELAPRLEMRQKLILEGRLLPDRGESIERFVVWAEGGPWLGRRPWLLWWCRLMALVVLLTLGLTGFGILSGDPAGLTLVGLVVLNCLTIAQFGGKVRDVCSPLNQRRGEATRYRRMFELIYATPESQSELDAVRREAMQLGGGVLRRLRQLSRIATLALLRHEPFLMYFVWLPLQLLFLYDFHALNLLEKWQARYGRYVRRWFAALGKFEALSSLAAVVHDHPRWTMPEVNPSADRFRARGLGHPLLTAETCVANDVEVGPEGSFLLVTGSNMSGKSTLLRAIGLNAVLAQAGGPVCAEQLCMPPVLLATSMRIRDCLENAVSFYMAELMRLKEIVDLARQAPAAKERTLLYLLDEILLGTNSRERHIAVMRVLQHLLHRRAIGAVSTHDLDLATSESLAAACRSVHFCETLHGADAAERMTFDYKLRPGIATTTNALKLLELVGLTEDERPTSSPLSRERERGRG